METNKIEQNEGKFGRRSFLKKSLIASAGLTAVGLGGSQLVKATYVESDKPKTIDFFPFRVKQYNKLEDIYKIDPNYKRMNQKLTIQSRSGWDPKIGMGDGEGRFMSFLTKWKDLVPNPHVEAGVIGYEKVALALDLATTGAQADVVGLSGAGTRNDGIFADWDRTCNPTVEKHEFESPEEAAKYIKRGALFVGADDVGIAPFDERWIYSDWYNLGKATNMPNAFRKPDAKIEEKAEFPFKVKSVIVILLAHDKVAIKVPGLLGSASAGLEYTHMAEVGHKIALYLNNLGYKAISAGNDTSLSVPTALQAGLGENSRMGTLIHPTLGSAVRIQKIYTDLEIKPDKPITFGVQEFCKKCMKCADKCPSDALSRDAEPSDVPTVASISSHPGVTKWFHDNEKCLSQWEKMGAGCGICLAVCPYNKPENWVHDVAKLAVGVPVGRDVARILDDSFGYGEIKPENVDLFWDNELK